MTAFHKGPQPRRRGRLWRKDKPSSASVATALPTSLFGGAHG